MMMQCGIVAKDIGVVSPYRGQLKLIRSHLENTGVPQAGFGALDELPTLMFRNRR